MPANAITPLAPGAPDAATVLTTLVTAWLLPATTAQRTARLRLLGAWLTHVLSTLLAVTLIFLLIAWAEAGLGTLTETLIEVMDLLEDTAREFGSAPGGILTPLLGIAALIEAGHLAVAFLVMPWGAKDEPVRDSFRHALRQTWLHTSHFLIAILLVGGVALSLEGLDRRWQASSPMPTSPPLTLPPPPTAAPTSPQYADAMTAYSATLAEYGAEVVAFQEQLSDWRAKKPWYIREPEPMIVTTGALVVLWILGALLRAVGADRHVAAIAHPPRCLHCGYNLTTMPLEARCPECGDSVAASLGPHAQPGIPWEHRGRLGTLTAWYRSTALALRRPTQTGRQVRLIDPPIAHRAFLAMHLPMVWLIGWASIVFAVVISDGWDDFTSLPALAFLVPILFGVVCTVGAIAFTCFVAFVVGLTVSLSAKRNLLPASMQTACYAFPALLLWEVLGAAIILLCNSLERAGFFDALVGRQAMGFPSPAVPLAIAAFVGLPNVACALVYFSFVYRATKAARFANK